MRKVAFLSVAVHCFQHQSWMVYSRVIKIIQQIFCLKWTFFRLGKHSNEFSRHLFPYVIYFSNNFRCALLELWSEGSTPFEFSQLLAYRSGDLELVTKHLEALENENLRNLIASMISRNPSDRKSAEVYLDEQRGK